MTKEIITQDYVKQLFEYRDGVLYWKVNKGKVRLGQKAGTLNNNYYRVQINGKQYRNHRIIFLMHHGFLPKHLDHIDGNKLNNKIENLREATHSQNMMNVKIKKNNTSGTKGVCFDKQRKKWLVRITIQNKDIHLGRFDDLELAELVAIEGRDKYHKSFARLF